MEVSDAGSNGLEDYGIQSLCCECKIIFDNWYERDNWSVLRPAHRHHNIVELQESAGKGCPVCAQLLQGLNDDVIQQMLKKRPKFKGFLRVENYSPPAQHYDVEIEFYDRLDGDDREILLDGSWETSVHLSPSVGDELGKVQNVANCEENWILIQKWRKICQDTRTKCSQSTIDRQLPTRLIYVGIKDLDLKLCQTDSLPPETPYLTLSHCWGRKTFTTLTRGNFQEFLSQIPIISLSKTFREAIETTRILGFRYLWIDSLCIIQGDEIDWQYEASRMGVVYENSALNIAASAAPNGNSRCFSSRTLGKVYGFKLLTRAHRYPSRYAPRTALWDCVIGDISSIMEHNVLSSRAWVFQEYFLAPRTLHFTAHQLVWDCRSSRTCETFPGGFNSGYPTLTALKTSIMLNGPNINDDIADKWGQVVAGYSGGSVIFRKDKVVALSGVARLFAERFGTTYLAGMWKEDLVKQLTWHTSTPSAIEIRGPIPSWSWASIDTRVNYLERDEIKPNFRPLVSILEATTVVSNDDFGDVKGGTIRMRCHLPIVATLMEQTAPAPPAIFRVDSGSAHMAHVMLWHDTTRYSVGDELCFVALLDATRWKGCLTGNEDIICGLVIEPVQPTSYRRTGYFEIVDYYGDFEEFEAAEDEATSESKYFIGESLGSDEDGREMCIITLI